MNAFSRRSYVVTNPAESLFIHLKASPECYRKHSKHDIIVSDARGKWEFNTKKYYLFDVINVPTIFDHERIEATLRDMMRNQFKDAAEYAYHLEQSKNYMENRIVSVQQGFILKYGNSEERKYVLSLHKIHAVPFPEEDLKEKMNSCVNRSGISRLSHGRSTVVNPTTRKIHGIKIMNIINNIRVRDNSRRICLYYKINEAVWVMDLVEFVKVCDVTLVEEVLKEVKMKIFETEFLKKAPLLGELDLNIMKALKREITKRLRHRKQMRRWESFVNERPILPTMRRK
ncbi:hypothetical protein Tco_0843334 [Tanacetum coccineum]|uniref:Uncharacterized protein n=1 Tax=Tanacetum coccineum TaxID=301880 RepID=A0ABQ5B4M0_9ASTR